MEETALNACFQCGECTAVCPMRRVSKFAPRSIIQEIQAESRTDAMRAVEGAEAGAVAAGDSRDSRDGRGSRGSRDSRAESKEWLWMCLLCGSCLMKCPQGVDFPQFILHAREEQGGAPEELLPHRELSQITEIMSILERGVPTDFEGETDESSEIGFFPGCLAYFDLFMDVSGVNYKEIGDYSLKLLNKIGIKPRILPLKCCGHDILFQGKRETFERLMAFNKRKIKESGIKMLILNCAECYFTFKKYYKLEEEGVKVVHLAEILAENVHFIRKAMKEASEASVKSSGTKAVRVAYHDPCALKMLGVYEAPREVLRAVAGVEFVELPHARENALCCGVSGMLLCNDATKALRAFRLGEVREVKADVLVTTCVKCLSHFNCLKREQERLQQKQGQAEEQAAEEEVRSSGGSSEYEFEICDLAVFLGRLLAESD
ncbi:MAG: Fe-S cluster-containing oxidoreductase [Methanophagales archaeon]|nr:(Fe-S)-binding protein [Methanophagales archaeon]MCU4140542.1 Fe-S cluster-containing oxidoreductase [Methanophagales archaeon]